MEKPQEKHLNIHKRITVQSTVHGKYLVGEILANNTGIIIIIIITSTSDLQPSTPTANQLPGQLVSTEIRTIYV